MNDGLLRCGRQKARSMRIRQSDTESSVVSNAALKCIVFAAILGISFGLISCSRGERSVTAPTTPTVTALQLVTSYSTSVTEPSGLAYSNATHTLYMISDNRSEIFKIDTTGKVLASIPVAATDIEGIAVSANDDTLFVVEETPASQVTAFLSNGTKLWSLPVNVYTQATHALEGITRDSQGHILVINEKLPTMLLDFKGTTEVSRKTLNYSGDLSDICYEPGADCLWIVSDESQSLMKLSRSGELLGQWSTAPVQQGEGIALIGNRLYIVSDSEAKLYVFVKP
jgi:uncharacterized protein YjiK